jgi:hypothetical protein
MSALGAGAQGCGGTGLAGALSQIEQGVRQVPGAVRVPAKQPPIGAPECWRDCTRPSPRSGPALLSAPATGDVTVLGSAAGRAVAAPIDLA